MASHPWLTCAVVFGATLLGGCGTRSDPPGKADDRTVSWRIDVGTPEESGFGARVMVNGEQVYLEAGTGLRNHRVDVVRPYVAGENLVEVEIVASSKSPAAYAVSCTAQVHPKGKIVHADGFPRTIGFGERLFLRISL